MIKKSWLQSSCVIAICVTILSSMGIVQKGIISDHITACLDLLQLDVEDRLYLL